MIDLDVSHRTSSLSNLVLRIVNVLELMAFICGPVPNNAFNIECSIINEHWPRSNIIPDIISTVQSPLVPCILSSVKMKPMGVF